MRYRNALDPHWPALVPSLCSIANSTAGPTKVASDRTLTSMLSLDQSTDKVHTFLASSQAVSFVRTFLTDSKLRVLSKISLEGDDDL